MDLLQFPSVQLQSQLSPWERAPNTTKGGEDLIKVVILASDRMYGALLEVDVQAGRVSKRM